MNEPPSFRPLPGTLLSNIKNSSYDSFGIRVSVPFRGLFYLIEYLKTVEKWEKMFPSPSGDSSI